MHLLTTPLLYRILTFKASPQRTRIIGAALLTMFTIVMVVHMLMDEFLLHAVSFGLGVFIIAHRTLKIIAQQVPEPILQKKIRNIAIFGCGGSICHSAGRNATNVPSLFPLRLLPMAD